MFKRFSRSIVGVLVGAIMLLALASFAAPSVAKADPYCAEYFEFFPYNICAAWSMPPGAQMCAGAMAANQADLFTGINYTGVCARVIVGWSVSDLGPSGWKYSIRSMKVGTSAHVYACNGASFGWGCSGMGYPYGQDFPNTAGSLNWYSAMAY